MKKKRASKTVWFNVAAAALPALLDVAEKLGVLLNARAETLKLSPGALAWYAVAVAAGNLVLRAYTDAPLAGTPAAARSRRGGGEG